MSMDGRVVMITGANTGIGRATAVALGRKGARLFLAGRSAERHAEVIEAVSRVGIAPAFLPLELGDFASVRACAERFLASGSPLHVLINNAGLAGARGRTEEGFELTFGVNHLGPFLLTELLLDRLRESAPSRIVNVASRAHYDAEGIDWEAVQKSTSSLTGFPEYQVSKLCNVLHARELAARLSGTGVTTYALHPGVIASDVWRSVPFGVRHLIRLFMKSPEQGAETSVHCASAETCADHSGRYYERCRERTPSSLALDDTLAQTLREKSAGWVGLG